MALFIALFLATFISLGLAGYHFYLAATNQTTYEFIKPQVLDNYLRDEIKRKRNYRPRMERQRQWEQRLAAPRSDDSDDAVNRDGNGDGGNQHDPAGNGFISVIEKDFVQEALKSSSPSSPMSQPGAARRRVVVTPAPGTPTLGASVGAVVNYIERESKHYFDEGFKRNMIMFLRGEVYEEWKSALPCINHSL